MQFKDRVVIVTGASKGIGRTTALGFAEGGATVFAVARNQGLLEALAAESEALAGQIIASPADVRQRPQVEKVVTEAQQRAGRIDILVNNAGIERVRPLDEVSDEEFAATIDTNLKGTFLFIRAVLPGMKAQKTGHIINVSSSAGLRGFAEDAVYCASKFGVMGLTDALDEELRGYGIRVSAVAPGAVDTDLAKDTWSPPDDPYRPHFLQPEDVANAILFVAAQPRHVTVPLITLLPLIEPPYSPPLPLEQEGQSPAAAD